MRKVVDWDTYFMDMAVTAATRSKDPSTQVGAVIINPHKHPVSSGYNGFAPGAEETEEAWERPAKYARVIHAEMNSIAHAAAEGVSTRGATMYVTLFPCGHCAKVIAAAGIVRLVAKELGHSGWDDAHKEAAQIFQDAGVESVLLTGVL